MGLLTKIAKRKCKLPETAGQQQPAANPVAQRLAETPKYPPIPCLICSCPVFWITTYDLADSGSPDKWQLRCGECEPPPGRSIVGAKWIVATDASGQPAWWRFVRGPADDPDDDRGGQEPPGGDPGGEAEAAASVSDRHLADWSHWHELVMPDGSKALAPPGWRRLNLLQLEHRYGFDRAWQMLQDRSDKFFDFELISQS